MTPQFYPIENQYQGDTFDELSFRFFDSDTKEGIILSGNIKIELYFYGGYEFNEIKKTLTLGDGLTITDASDGIVRIDTFKNDLEADTYQYEIKIFFPNEEEKTYVAGTMTVENRKSVNE